MSITILTWLLIGLALVASCITFYINYRADQMIRKSEEARKRIAAQLRDSEQLNR